MPSSVEVGRGQAVVEAVAASGEDEVELGEGFERAEQGVGDLADLGAEPSEDPADLLGFLGSEEGELGRLLGDGLGLDVDGLVAGAGPVDGALDLASMLLGDRQDVMVADHREVGVAEDALDLVRSEHPGQGFLDPVLDLAHLAAESGEAAAGGVEDLASLVDARLDRVGHAVELADVAPHPAEPGELVADPCRARARLAIALSDSTTPASSSGSRRPPTWARRTIGRMSWRPPKGGNRPEAERIGHLGRQGLAVADLAGSRLGSIRSAALLAQRAGRLRGHQGADLVEFEQFQRVRVHDPSRRPRQTPLGPPCDTRPGPRGSDHRPIIACRGKGRHARHLKRLMGSRALLSACGASGSGWHGGSAGGRSGVHRRHRIDVLLPGRSWRHRRPDPCR